MKTLSKLFTLMLMFAFVGTSYAQPFDYGTGGASDEASHNVSTLVMPWCYIAIEGGDEALVIHTLDDGSAVFEDNTTLHYGTNDPDPSSVNVTYARATNRGYHLDLRVEAKNLVPHANMTQSGFPVHYPSASNGSAAGYIPLAFGAGGDLITGISSGGGTADLEYRLWEYFFGAPGEDVTEVTYTMTADCGDSCGGDNT